MEKPTLVRISGIGHLQSGEEMSHTDQDLFQLLKIKFSRKMETK